MTAEELIRELSKAHGTWPIRLWCEGVEMTVKEVRIDVERHIVILAKVAV